MNKAILYGLFLGMGIIVGSISTYFLGLNHHPHTHLEEKMNLTHEERKQIKELF